MNSQPLHITIAAAPNPEIGNPKLLEHDLRLTKASILYADRVKLCTLGAWLGTKFDLASNLEMSVEQRFDILMGFTPMLSSDEIKNINLDELGKMQAIMKKKPVLLTRKERTKISEFKKIFPKMWNELSVSFNEILIKFGFDEIKLAATKGLLEIHPFSTSESKKFVQEYFSVVEDTLGSSDTHPMFDERTSNLVRLALEVGKVSVRNANTRKSKQIGLVSDLFNRLPIFDIPIDELLDIREELSKPLINFRSEMIKLSNDIETAAWDEDFPSDVQEIYQSKVEPSLSEIEDKLKSTSFREFWSKRVVDKYGFLAGGLGFSSYLGAAVSPIVGIASALVTASLFTESGFAELREKANEIERNGLYFYYQMKNH